MGQKGNLLLLIAVPTGISLPQGIEYSPDGQKVCLERLLLTRCLASLLQLRQSHDRHIAQLFTIAGNDGPVADKLHDADERAGGS